MYSVNSGAKLSKNLVTYAIPAKKIIEKAIADCNL